MSEKTAQAKTLNETSSGMFQRQLSIVAGQIDLAVDRLFNERFNLNNTEWQVLFTLTDGRMSFNEVVERSAMDKARVSRAQKRLIDRGFMRSVPHAEDGRRVILSLTAEGELLVDQMLPEIERIEAWVLATLSAEERTIMTRVIGKLVDQCLGRPSIPPAATRRRPPAGI